MEKELTDQELDRLDLVHNTILDMMSTLAGQPVKWDMEIIGEISDIVEDYVCGKLKIMTPKQFAPYV